MTTTFIAVFLVLFAIAVGIWWRIFFGKPNPPLPRANVTVVSTSSLPGASIAVAPSSTVSTTAVSATDTSIANPPLATESLTVDGAQFSVEIASTSVEQTRGLSYRPSLGVNDGMLFLFGTGSTQTFWMKDMNFPLDMIWISGDTIAGFTANIPAPASGTPLWELIVYPSPPDVDKVLEVNAGTVAKYNIKVGDTVSIGPTTE